MDLLGTVLLTLKVIDSSIGIFELKPPWGFAMPHLSDDFVFIFAPIDTACWLSVEGAEPVRVDAGDSAMVLGGAAHVYRSAPDAPVVALPPLWASRGLPELGPGVSRSGPVRFTWQPSARSRAPTQRLLTLALVVQGAARNPVLSALPRLMLLRQSEGRLFPWLPPALQLLEAEEGADTPGYEVTARHHATLIFTSLLRAHAVSQRTGRASWLRGLTDPQIGQALALMHGQPGEPWALLSLARACGMSRSNFARRFAALVGSSVMAHLTAVRMSAAAEQLTAGVPVSTVAAQVGFRSEWSFRQAFVRQYGSTPLRYGKASRSGAVA